METFDSVDATKFLLPRLASDAEATINNGTLAVPIRVHWIEGPIPCHPIGRMENFPYPRSMTLSLIQKLADAFYVLLFLCLGRVEPMMQTVRFQPMRQHLLIT